MTAEMPPPWYNVPAFGYQPEHGSYGVPPLILDQSSVSVTSVQEGYPEMHMFNGEEFTYTQKLNALRLYTLIWCSNVKAAICMLLGSEPSRGLDSQVNRFLHSRFGARPTNPIYHMVQENVERYDLGVNIRNLARTAMVLRLPIAGESQEKITRREELANEYRAASFGLRDRAIAAINKGIADPTLEGMRGQVLASRLMGIRTELAADPFDNPDASDKEPLYSELTRNAKQNFWLGRYDENVVAWHWTLRGVVDIRETIKEEPMKTYCKEQFYRCTCASGSVWERSCARHGCLCCYRCGPCRVLGAHRYVLVVLQLQAQGWRGCAISQRCQGPDVQLQARKRLHWSGE
jgi:hypothetical protein